jgi:NAD(P)-dependent dehydrogenase (short-subunit alcohol dehydrogenase family)
VAQESAARGITVNVIAPGYIAPRWCWRCRRRFWTPRSCSHIPSAVSAPPMEVAR